MPPFSEILDAVLRVLLPAAGTAAFVLTFAVLLLGPRVRHLAMIVGFALAWGVGNYLRDAPLPWLPEKSPWHWLPWMGVGLMILGSLRDIPSLPSYVPWILMLAGVGFASWKMFPKEILDKTWWMLPASMAVGTGNAAVMWAMSRREPGGWGAFASSISFMGAASIIIHAHFAKLTDAGMIFGAAWFGIAVVAQLNKVDAGSVVFPMTALLPSMMMSAKEDSFSQVLPISFLLPAVAPLVMAIFLIPPFSALKGRIGWWMPLFALAIPLGIALMKAMQVESLAME